MKLTKKEFPGNLGMYGTTDDAIFNDTVELAPGMGTVRFPRRLLVNHGDLIIGKDTLVECNYGNVSAHSIEVKGSLTAHGITAVDRIFGNGEVWSNTDLISGTIYTEGRIVSLWSIKTTHADIRSKCKVSAGNQIRSAGNIVADEIRAGEMIVARHGIKALNSIYTKEGIVAGTSIIAGGEIHVGDGWTACVGVEQQLLFGLHPSVQCRRFKGGTVRGTLIVKEF